MSTPSTLYTPPLDSTLFNTESENFSSTDEIQANLELWVNTKFTNNGLLQESDVPTELSISYSNVDSNANAINQPFSITYESLANYLDFELPQQHLLTEEQSKQHKTQSKISKKKRSQKILPKITSVAMLEDLKNNLVFLDQDDDSSSTCSAKSPMESTSNKERSANEEEKRKRNTAASARFRVKKKQKEQMMERTVEDMTSKSKGLEKRVHELESEIKFLKSLLIERDSS